jgi:archaellum component FlaC
MRRHTMSEPICTASFFEACQCHDELPEVKGQLEIAESNANDYWEKLTKLRDQYEDLRREYKVARDAIKTIAVAQGWKPEDWEATVRALKEADND